MKKVICTLTVFLMLISGSIKVTNAQGTDIVILHTSDSHSHLEATGPKNWNLEGTLGGISKAASVIGSVKLSEKYVLTLHAGDFMVGDFFFNAYFGVPELQLMKQIGFDALAVGNHEFDFGPSTLNDVLTGGFANGSFPVLSANLNLSGYPPLMDHIQPYTIKDFDGIKVGIFGMTIPSPLSNPDPVIIREDVAEVAYATVLELQAQGADVIVCLSHLGSAIDALVAANVPGINFIIGGHDHIIFDQPQVVMNPLNEPVYLCQSGAYYHNIGRLNFSFYKGEVIYQSYQLIPVDKNVPPVPEIKAVVDDLKLGIEAQYGNVFTSVDGYALRDMEGLSDPDKSKKDSPMGNLITDSYRHKTNTKIGITAQGLIAEKIYQGPVTSADLFRTVSYGFDTTNGLNFRLATFDISGAELIKGLEIGLSLIGVDDDFFLQVSGMKFKYNPSNPPGERVVLPTVKIGNRHINPGSMYSVTVNEGLLGILLSLGGVVVENIQIIPDNEYLVLKDFVQHKRILNYKPEGRIMEVGNGDNSESESDSETEVTENDYVLSDNYPNPFNPSTTINYHIPVNGPVTLKIYDMVGKEVASLVNQIQEKGNYSVKWDATAFSSGVYFYKIQSGNFVQTKRMILMK